MHCRFKMTKMGLCSPWIELFCAELNGQLVPGISKDWKQFRVTAEERSYAFRL